MEKIKNIIPEPLNGRVIIEMIKEEPKSELYGVEPKQPNLGKVVKAYHEKSTENVGVASAPILPEGTIVQFNTGVPPVKIEGNPETIVSIRYTDIFHKYTK